MLLFDKLYQIYHKNKLLKVIQKFDCCYDSVIKVNEMALNLDVFKQQLIEVKYIFNSKTSLFRRLIITKTMKLLTAVISYGQRGL